MAKWVSNLQAGLLEGLGSSNTEILGGTPGDVAGSSRLVAFLVQGIERFGLEVGDGLSFVNAACSQAGLRSKVAEASLGIMLLLAWLSSTEASVATEEVLVDGGGGITDLQAGLADKVADLPSTSVEGCLWRWSWKGRALRLAASSRVAETGAANLGLDIKLCFASLQARLTNKVANLPSGVALGLQTWLTDEMTDLPSGGRAGISAGVGFGSSRCKGFSAALSNLASVSVLVAVGPFGGIVEVGVSQMRPSFVDGLLDLIASLAWGVAVALKQGAVILDSFSDAKLNIGGLCRGGNGKDAGHDNSCDLHVDRKKS